MERRTFGSTGIEVSPICFGSMRLDPSPGAAEAARRALEAALDAGVNLLHSSDSYGTRAFLGEVLAGRSERTDLHHVVKVCAPDYSETTFDAGAFRRQVEEALRELGAERITFVQHLHRGVTKQESYSVEGDARRLSQLAEMRDDIRAVFENLRQEGKVGHFLTFPHTRGFAGEALEAGPYEGLVAFFNVLEREMADLFGAMEARGQGMFAMRPLLQGMLSERRADRGRLDPDDRMRSPDWDDHYRRLDAIRDRLGAEIRPLETFALRFSLAPPAVASVIVSLNTEKQVEAAVAAVREISDAPTLERIAALDPAA